MPQGLQVFDSGGNVIFDTSNRLSRTAGTAIVGAESSGSLNSPLFLQGTPFAVWCQTAGPAGYMRYSFNGATFNWWKGNDGSYYTPDLSTVRGYFVVGSF